MKKVNISVEWLSTLMFFSAMFGIVPLLLTGLFMLYASDGDEIAKKNFYLAMSISVVLTLITTVLAPFAVLAPVAITIIVAIATLIQVVTFGVMGLIYWKAPKASGSQGGDGANDGKQNVDDNTDLKA